MVNVIPMIAKELIIISSYSQKHTHPTYPFPSILVIADEERWKWWRFGEDHGEGRLWLYDQRA